MTTRFSHASACTTVSSAPSDGGRTHTNAGRSSHDSARSRRIVSMLTVSLVCDESMSEMSVSYARSAPGALAAERTYDIYGNATDEQTAFWDHCVLVFELQTEPAAACDTAHVSALLDEWIESAVVIASDRAAVLESSPRNHVGPEVATAAGDRGAAAATARLAANG